MKKVALIIMALGIASTLFTACEKNESTKECIIPIKKGNTWTYSTFYVDDKTTGSVTLEVGDLKTIEGVSGYKYGAAGSSSEAFFLANNDQEGNFVLIGGCSDVDTLIEPSIMYKLNSQVGDSWDYTEIILNEDNTFESNLITIHCKSTNTLIQTTKGDFNCMVFEYSPNSGEDVFKTYISKNVGIIKSEHYELENLFSYRILTDYSLK